PRASRNQTPRIPRRSKCYEDFRKSVRTPSAPNRRIVLSSWKAGISPSKLSISATPTYSGGPSLGSVIALSPKQLLLRLIPISWNGISAPRFPQKNRGRAEPPVSQISFAQNPRGPAHFFHPRLGMRWVDVSSYC